MQCLTLNSTTLKVVLIHLCWKGKFILTVFYDVSMQPGTIWSNLAQFGPAASKFASDNIGAPGLYFWSFMFCPNNTVKNLIFRKRFPGMVPLLQWRMPGVLLLLQRLLYMLHLLLRGDCLGSSSCCCRGCCFVGCLSSCCSCCLGRVCLDSSSCCRRSCYVILADLLLLLLSLLLLTLSCSTSI
jgi:hypothetical protein